MTILNEPRGPEQSLKSSDILSFQCPASERDEKSGMLNPAPPRKGGIETRVYETVSTQAAHEPPPRFNAPQCDKAGLLMTEPPLG